MPRRLPSWERPLTVDQLRQVRRFSREVCFFFDGDEAGRRAATRAYPLCLEAGVNGRGIFLPQGEDPDSFARSHGQAGLDSLIERAASLQDFYLRRHALPPGASAFQRAQGRPRGAVRVEPERYAAARRAADSGCPAFRGQRRRTPPLCGRRPSVLSRVAPSSAASPARLLAPGGRPRRSCCICC